LLKVDCSRALDLAHEPQTSSRHYDVSNDNTLTAVDPLAVQISIIRTYQPMNYLPFFAVAGFESRIDMAMFVQLLGDEATCRDIHWELGPKPEMPEPIAQAGGRMYELSHTTDNPRARDLKLRSLSPVTNHDGMPFAY